MKNTTALFSLGRWGNQLFKDVHMENENILMKFFIQKKTKYQKNQSYAG